MANIARFRLTAPHYFQPGDLYVDKDTEVEIGPGTPYPDMKPSMAMVPLNDAAEKFAEDWENERGGRTDPLSAKAFPAKGHRAAPERPHPAKAEGEGGAGLEVESIVKEPGMPAPQTPPGRAPAPRAPAPVPNQAPKRP